jgi:hypothetical protein
MTVAAFSSTTNCRKLRDSGTDRGKCGYRGGNELSWACSRMRLHSYTSVGRAIYLPSVRCWSIRPCWAGGTACFRGKRPSAPTDVVPLGGECLPYAGSRPRLQCLSCRACSRSIHATQTTLGAVFRLAYRSVGLLPLSIGDRVDDRGRRVSRHMQSRLPAMPSSATRHAPRPTPHAPALPIVCRCALQRDGAGSLASEECLVSMAQRPP